MRSEMIIGVTLDVATDRVRAVGFPAARVLVPGFARLQPAAFRLDPEGRLIRARRALGWVEDSDSPPYSGW